MTAQSWKVISSMSTSGGANGREKLPVELAKPEMLFEVL